MKGKPGWGLSPSRLLLDGEWQFSWFEAPERVPEQWLVEDLPDACPIKVPGNWQLAAAYPGARPVTDVPIYTNIKYPFPLRPAPGACREPHRLLLPRVHRCCGLAGRGADPIIFDGVDSAFHLFCNGRWVGYSQDSRLPAEFDLTPSFRPGPTASPSWCCAGLTAPIWKIRDMWRMSGIFRSVSLLHKPTRHLMDIRVTPELDACYRDARLKVELQAANGAGLSVEANLYDGDERVATLRQRIGTQAIDEKGCMTIAPSCG